MKINKLKTLLIAICCFVSALCSEIQCMETETDNLLIAGGIGKSAIIVPRMECPTSGLSVCAILEFQPTQAMEDYFSKAVPPIQRLFLKEVFSRKDDQEGFGKTYWKLSLVSKKFDEIVKKNAQKWICEYYDIEEKDQQDFWSLFKGKLIYTSSLNKMQIKLPFSALPNPLAGTFDLSQCDNAGKYLSINIGYKEEMKEKNNGKIEIWFVPRFQIEKDIKEGKSKPLNAIFPSKWPQTAQMGILWTKGRANYLYSYDYLTWQDLDELSDGNNLYEKWKQGEHPILTQILTHIKFEYERTKFEYDRHIISHFTYRGNGSCDPIPLNKEAVRMDEEAVRYGEITGSMSCFVWETIRR